MACDMCKKRAEKKVREVDGKKVRHCDECDGPIANHVGMGGAGFESPTADHLHPNAPNVPIHKELCAECFKKAYAKAFPGHEATPPAVIPG